MSAPVPTRVVYPLRAKIVVALAASCFLAELTLLALFMMPLFPLVPVFVTFMLGQACLLGSLKEYVTSLARSEPVELARARETSREAPAKKAAQAAA